MAHIEHMLLFTYLIYRSQTSSGSSPSYIRTSDSNALEKQKKKQIRNLHHQLLVKSVEQKLVLKSGGKCNVKKIIHTVSAGWWQSWLRPVVDWAPDVRLIWLCHAAVAECFLCLAPIPHLLPLPLWNFKQQEAYGPEDTQTQMYQLFWGNPSHHQHIFLHLHSTLVIFILNGIHIEGSFPPNFPLG